MCLFFLIVGFKLSPLLFVDLALCVCEGGGQAQAETQTEEMYAHTRLECLCVHRTCVPVGVEGRGQFQASFLQNHSSLFLT